MQAFIKIFLASLLLMPFPITFSKIDEDSWVFGVEFAYADDDDDDDDEDDDDDDDDEDDDDDDDDDEDDDDDDEDEDDEDDDDDENGGNGQWRPQSSGGNDQTSGQRTGAVADLHLRYPNGWDERILNGRYILTDPEGRTVSNRRATFDDLERMRELAGL